MQSQATITLDHNCLLISGEINFTTAAALWMKSLPLLAQCKNLLFDFSKVTSINSAALALLLEWIKYAKKVSKPIAFRNVSLQLQSIATVAGICSLLE